MAQQRHITEKALGNALRRHAGVCVLAARELGCDRSNITHRIRNSPKLQKIVQEIEDEVGDIAVGVIIDSIVSKKDVKTAKWYASMKLKDRGYSNRTEVTGADGAPLPAQAVSITVNYVDPKPTGQRRT